MIFGVVLVIVAVYIFVNKSYYPSLPIDNLSANEVLEKLKSSDEKIAEIAAADDSIWYITRSRNKDHSAVDENIKQMMNSNGWEFRSKEGSGLFFEKEDEQLIVTTQMWTKKYVVVQVPNAYREH